MNPRRVHGRERPAMHGFVPQVTIALAAGTMLSAGPRSRNSGGTRRMVSEATPRTYCPNCGSETSAGDQFCRSCGHSLTGSISAAAAATGAPAAVVVAPASRRGWLALGVVIFLAIVAAAAFIGLQASGVLSPRHTITGTFDLIDTSGISSGISFLGGTCEGDGGYGDISAGTNVSLKDGDGKLLAST
ncbi:MAG: zinc-ribbon domain-containing protein, partial [Chloroflexi bacterium]|nr:zinc-ribbon domain-containing protein [Chloroflexota bacterium]